MTDYHDPDAPTTEQQSLEMSGCLSPESSLVGEAVPEKIQEEKYSFRDLLKDVFETVILAIVIYTIVNLVSARYIVLGYSMEPTLHSGEYLIVEKVSYRFTEPERGDVIVFDYPLHTEDDYVKRIVGLPGDKITITDGVVMVNDLPLEESYTLTDTPGSQTWTVSEDSYFVMGDNRRGSSDSRSWGELKKEYIIGRVWMIYWPLKDIGLVAHHDFR